MAAEEKVVVEIGAEDNASPTINKVADNTEKFGKTAEDSSKRASFGFTKVSTVLKTLGGVVAGLGIGATLYRGFNMAIAAARGAEEQMARFDAMLGSMGEKGLQAKDKILQVADSMVKLGFDDEDAAESMAKLYQRTGDLQQAQEYLALSADLARAKHMDLNSATVLVGQVLAGNGKLLKQYGIDLKDAASPMEALRDLQEKVAGQSEAYANTYNGQIERLSITWQNFLEEVGTPILEWLTIIINKFLDWIDAIGGVQAIMENFKVVANSIAPIVQVMAFIINAAIVSIQTTIRVLYTAWLETSRFIETSTIVVSQAWDAMMQGISGTASAVWEGIKNTFKEGINILIKYINGFINAYNAAVSKVPGGKSMKINTFTPLAEGGVVTKPTFALIGEAGPEAVIPLSKGKNSGMGGVTIVLSGNNFYGDDEEFAMRIGDTLMKRIIPHLNFQTV